MLKDTLSDIQKKLHVPKNRKNSFGGYNYRNAEDIVDAVKELLPEGVSVTVDDEIIVKADRYYICSTARLISANEIMEARGWAREPLEKKGMDASQLTGSTASYAKKYALCNLFAIDDGVDADSSPQPQRATAIPKSNASSGKPKVISAAQVKRLQTIASINKVAPEKAKEIIKRHAGVDSAKDIPWQKYEAICNEIEGK